MLTMSKSHTTERRLWLRNDPINHIPTQGNKKKHKRGLESWDINLETDKQLRDEECVSYNDQIGES